MGALNDADGIDAIDRAFFAAYADGFNRADADGIVDAYELPALIASDDGVAFFTDRTEFRGAVGRLLAHYQETGFGRAGYVISSSRALSDRMRQVEVTWQAFREDGGVLWESLTLYHLRLGSAGWRIICVLNPAGR